MLSFILSLPLSRVYDRDIHFSFFISGCFFSFFMCLDSTSACFLFSSHFYSSFIFLVSLSFISLCLFSLPFYLSISLLPSLTISLPLAASLFSFLPLPLPFPPFSLSLSSSLSLPLFNPLQYCRLLSLSLPI